MLTYPLSIFDVNISSSSNQISYYFIVAFFSRHMKRSYLIEEKKYKIDQKLVDY